MDKLLFTHVAWDGCHKIYLIQDQADLDKLTELGYQIHKPTELARIWAQSCPLRFIDTAKLVSIIPQASKISSISAWEYNRGKFALSVSCDDSDTENQICEKLVDLMTQIADTYTGSDFEPDWIEQNGYESGFLSEMRDLCFKWLEGIIEEGFNENLEIANSNQG